MKRNQTLWREDPRTEKDDYRRLREIRYLVGSLDRSAQTFETQSATLNTPQPPVQVCVIEGPIAAPCDARILRDLAGRRISHGGSGTPGGSPARSPGRSTTLSTTARSCSRPAGSNTFSCSRPLSPRTESRSPAPSILRWRIWCTIRPWLNIPSASVRCN